jgi:RsmE family RNA methyltransferase
MPRPQTSRALLRDVSALGASALHFVAADKGDPNYALSSLWHSGEWRRHLISGAEQAFCTRLPQVTFGRTLSAVVLSLSSSGESRIALDNYEAPQPLSRVNLSQSSVCLAFGPERGWSAVERDFFRHNGFNLAHLGSRVLRIETACVAAIALTKAKMDWL